MGGHIWQSFQNYAKHESMFCNSKNAEIAGLSDMQIDLLLRFSLQ